MTEQEVPEIEKEEKKGFPSIYEIQMGIEPTEPVCAETCEELRTAQMQNRPVRLPDRITILQERIVGRAEALYDIHEADGEIEEILLELFEVIAELKELRNDARA